MLAEFRKSRLVVNELSNIPKIGTISQKLCDKIVLLIENPTRYSKSNLICLWIKTPTANESDAVTIQ
jgi:hypothetical protein